MSDIQDQRVENSSRDTGSVKPSEFAPAEAQVVSSQQGEVPQGPSKEPSAKIAPEARAASSTSTQSHLPTEQPRQPHEPHKSEQDARHRGKRYGHHHRRPYKQQRQASEDHGADQDDLYEQEHAEDQNATKVPAKNQEQPEARPQQVQTSHNEAHEPALRQRGKRLGHHHRRDTMISGGGPAQLKQKEEGEQVRREQQPTLKLEGEQARQEQKGEKGQGEQSRLHRFRSRYTNAPGQKEQTNALASSLEEFVQPVLQLSGSLVDWKASELPSVNKFLVLVFSLFSFMLQGFRKVKAEGYSAKFWSFSLLSFFITIAVFSASVLLLVPDFIMWLSNGLLWLLRSMNMRSFHEFKAWASTAFEDAKTRMSQSEVIQKAKTGVYTAKDAAVRAGGAVRSKLRF